MRYPEFMYSPRFIVIERGLIPDIRLPDDYLQKVPEFYKRGGRESVEEYVKQLNGAPMQMLYEFYEPDDMEIIRLNWDDERGLTNISIGVQSGLDLDERSNCFQEHNLGTQGSVISGAIAMHYLWELLKCEPS